MEALAPSGGRRYVSKIIMLKLIGSIFLLYGIYCLWAGLHSHWLYFIYGSVSISCGAGLAMKKIWSKYIVYILSLAISSSWLYMTFLQIRNGNFPYQDPIKSIVGLIPGICLLIFCGASSYIAYKKLKRET